jgi:FkbH-like protein
MSLSSPVTSPEASPLPPPPPGKKVIKALVWDLDNTLWNGTLLEGDDIRLREGVVETLQTLDSRGILQSIASRNDSEHALGKLRELGLADYFLYPQINWSSKAANIERIAKLLNIGLDAIAFIDDQPFERDEVRYSLPQVLTYDASELAGLSERKELIPRFITDESALRRRMYQADAQRNQVETEFVGSQDEFLASLDMRFSIAPAREEDLKRAEELTVRTNQLNTTGYTYSYEELDTFRLSPDHLLLVASLDDKYGTYGKIGLTLIEKGREAWTVRLLLMSCRVMARGVGSILINYLLHLAREAGVRLQAEFKSNDRNRMMLVTYKFAGFREAGRRGDLTLFEHDLSQIQPYPEYVRLDLRAS